MKIAELKRQLNAMDKAELISILCKFYKASKQCQAILDVEVCGASAEAPLIESCRKKIHAAFHTVQQVFIIILRQFLRNPARPSIFLK